MRPSRTNRWLSTMLRKMERFQRIASWPHSPRMLFLLRYSPVHWMRERLWLLARLEPRVRVANRNLTNTFHFSYAAALMADRVVHRNSTILLRLNDASPQAALPRGPAMQYERTDGGRAPASQVAYPTALPFTPLPQLLPRRELAPRVLSEIPLVARLGQRAKRVDDFQPDLPARLVRTSLAAPPPVAAQGAGPSGSPAVTSFPRANGTPAWPASAAPAAPVNVQQLTSEVLRQLDRRLIASRERLGRI